MRLIALLWFLVLPLSLWSQQLNRYMVFFTDKEQNTFTLTEPLEFLSARALERREEQQIDLTISDLPVSEPYVEAVESTGASVYYRSRWFNAVLVETSEDNIFDILSLPNVKEVKYIAPGSRLGQQEGAKQTPKNRRAAPLSIPPSSIQNEFLGISQMQQAGFHGEGKLIAVLDGGFVAVDQLSYFQHVFQEGKLLGQHDFTTRSEDVFRYSSHGTKALSTIAALDSGNFIGTAPQASFLLAVTEDVSTEYVIEEYNWLLAAEWADSAGADVITASLGYYTFDDPEMNYTYADMDGQTTVSARAVQFASEKGILVVTSAGNTGLGQWKYIVTPADAPHVLAVGAVDENRNIAGFSSVGPTPDGRLKPEVVALGVRTTVANPAGGFTTGSGTSFAAPQVAGLAASVWQAYPGLSNLELRELIMRSGSRAHSPDSSYGWGIPYYPRIEELVEPVEGVRIFPNPLERDQLYIRFLQSTGSGAVVDLLSVTGQRLLRNQRLTTLQTSENTYILYLNGLNTGIYFLHISETDKQYVYKILKQ